MGKKKTDIKTSPNEIWQSNYITNASYDFSLWERRILMRVAMEVDREIREKGAVERVGESDGKFLSFDVRDIVPDCVLGKRDMYYYKEMCEILKAITALRDKRIDYHSKSGDGFKVSSFLLKGTKKDGQGKVDIIIDGELWNFIIDLRTRGFIKIDLIVYFSLKSSYAMRFYEVLKYQDDLGNKTFVLSEELLRERLGCVDNYIRPAAFEKYVLERAKQELDEKSPLSFEYEVVKQRKKVYDINFTLVHLPHNIRETEIEVEEKPKRKYVTAKDLEQHLPFKIISYLQRGALRLSAEQIAKNIYTFKEFYQAFGESTIAQFADAYNYIYEKYGDPRDNLGAFIQNLKEKTEKYAEKYEMKKEVQASNIIQPYKAEERVSKPVSYEEMKARGGGLSNLEAISKNIKGQKMKKVQGKLPF